MKYLNDIIEFISGSPQFRIKEVSDKKAPLYTYYSQSDIEDDLVNIDSLNTYSKQVRTLDNVNTLSTGDIIFSLISGRSTIVGKSHDGYLYTQNYVKLLNYNKVDKKYLVYLLNEDKRINKQFQIGLQGSQVLKYTINQLKDLEIPELPGLKKQKIVGELYFNQLRLEALRNRAAKLETTILLERIKGVNK